jgi:predicted RNA-binding protein YlxR (DUF448 family)
MGQHTLSDGERTDAPDDAPERTCALSRARRAPDELIRFVRDPAGVIVPDVASRLPGRGVWVSCSRKAVAEAARRGVFARSLKRPVTVPDGLDELVERLLVRRACEALSLANKAGSVISGFTKTDIAISRGEAVALVHASDAADHGVGKLDRKFKAVWAELELKGEAPVITQMSSAELSLAIGRSNVVHAALTQGGAAKHFLKEAGRLKRYRSSMHGEAARPQPGSDTEQA